MNGVQQFVGEMLGSLGNLLQKPEVLVRVISYAIEAGIDPQKQLSEDARAELQKFALTLRREYGRGL